MRARRVSVRPSASSAAVDPESIAQDREPKDQITLSYLAGQGKRVGLLGSAMSFISAGSVRRPAKSRSSVRSGSRPPSGSRRRVPGRGGHPNRRAFRSGFRRTELRWTRAVRPFRAGGVGPLVEASRPGSRARVPGRPPVNASQATGLVVFPLHDWPRMPRLAVLAVACAAKNAGAYRREPTGRSTCSGSRSGSVQTDSRDPAAIGQSKETSEASFSLAAGTRWVVTEVYRREQKGPRAGVAWYAPEF